MLDIRTKKYTLKEFRGLDRNADGDIINFFDHFLLLKPAQVEMLTEDDWSRYHEYQDELAYELQSLSQEFGI